MSIQTAEQPPEFTWLRYFLLFAFASGALAHLLPAVLPVTRYTTDPLLLIINGFLLYAVYEQNGDQRLWGWLAFAYVFTFFTEAAGVATGAIFGEYHYGATMRWQWLGVPFVIALNWAVLTLAANDLSLKLTRSPWLAAALAGIFLALYDVAIEPIAIALDYWQWAAPTVPIQNYLAWALVAFLISVPLQLMKIRFRSSLLLLYFFAQLAFFLILNGGRILNLL
ncbi:MAG: carotenoid biosynthesis protein [Bacteroidota bacterium]